MRGEQDRVSWAEREAVCSDGSNVEYCRLSRHVSVYYAKLLRVRRPGHIMNRPFLVCIKLVVSQYAVYSDNLTKINSRVEASICTEQVQRRLAIVALAGLVDLGLSQYNQACAFIVPLQLNLVALEEVLLRHGGIEIWNIEDLHCGRQTLCAPSALQQEAQGMLMTYLTLWNEDGD